MWGDNNSTMQSEGGFMDTSANNSTMSGDKSSFKRGQNCVPMMIAHLNRYGEDIQVWGISARLVTFVAIVDNIETSSTKVNFMFRDETGIIKGTKWLEGDISSYESPVTKNSYARVYGTMRNQGEEKFILILNIQPMEHLSELLSHLMEVTVMSLEGEKLMNTVAQSDNTFVNRSITTSTTNTTSTMFEGDNPAGLNREQLTILNIIRNSDSEYGAERDAIKAQVPLQLAAKVDDILEFLSGEGHIYTTKTDDYFKVIS